jgi:cysteine desulfurase
MEAYLDNAATTKVSDKVAGTVNKVMTIDYGNPSSMHIKGMQAENYVKEARKKIAATLKCRPEEIIFTSGGSESNNMALIGSALANSRRGKHIIASAFEHASVSNTLLFLESLGFQISFAPVDSLGHVKKDELINMIKDDTILVSIMYVNNELGAKQDIAALSKAVKEKKPDIIFHSDCIQSYGKYKINPAKEGIDIISVSGHKIHGPKGTGFIYIKDKTKIKPIIYGGGQQNGFRSGTENVPGIAGLAQAAADIYENHDVKIEEMYSLKQWFVKEMSATKGFRVNCITDDIHECAPHIVSVSMEGVRAEVMLHALEERGVYVSSGSACSSNHPGISGSLEAVGILNSLLDSTLRFSFSVNTTLEELKYAKTQIDEIYPRLLLHRRR